MLPLCSQRCIQHLVQSWNSVLLQHLLHFYQLQLDTSFYLFVSYGLACTLWHGIIYLNYQQVSSILSDKSTYFFIFFISSKLVD